MRGELARKLENLETHHLGPECCPSVEAGNPQRLTEWDAGNNLSMQAFGARGRECVFSWNGQAAVHRPLNSFRHLNT